MIEIFVAGFLGSLQHLLLRCLEGRERLLTAFEEVNSHFGVLFKTLFGGGHAHLTLTESDDPLEAGLEIMASPPGKKLQSLSLLHRTQVRLIARLLRALLLALFA